MIHFVQGKPGGGKTLYALRLIIAELVRGNRRVVTNVALKLPELNEYLQIKYPKETINLFERVRILQEAELKTFWQFRAPPGENYETWAHGALIVLDEVHLYFNARKWMDTGDACLHYLSQHRKLGDDVICVTQHPDNVDKQFRSVAQDFSVIKNGYTAKIGWFRGLPMFTRTSYNTQPSGTKQEPFETARFQLDAKGMASCYDTAAGVGVLGRSADTKKAPRGIHPGWFIFGAICFALMLGAGVKYSGYRATKRLSDSQKIAPKLEKPVEVPLPYAPPPVLAAVGSSSPMQLHGAAKPLPDDDSVLWVRGYAVRGDKVNVFLSDGRVLTEDDSELERVRRNGVVISGQKIHMRIAKAKPETVAIAAHQGVPDDGEGKTKEPEKLEAAAEKTTSASLMPSPLPGSTFRNRASPKPGATKMPSASFR